MNSRSLSKTTVKAALGMALATWSLGFAGCEYQTQQPITERTVETDKDTGMTPAGGNMTEPESIKALEDRITELRNQVANSTSSGDSEQIKALQDQITQLQSVIEEIKKEPPAATSPTPEPGRAPRAATPPAATTPVAREDDPIITVTPGAFYSQLVYSEVAADCTPPTYTDGRTAVPLVITGWRDVERTEDRARFVKDTNLVALDGRLSSLKIEKGPNYVEGDEVEFHGYLALPWYAYGQPQQPKPYSIRLGPGEYPDLRDLNLRSADGSNLEADDRITSLKIVRANNLSSKSCAEVPPDDPLAWKKEIHVIAEIYQDADYEGMYEQVINDVADLTDWGKDKGDFDNTISSVKGLKGPHYKAGDYVRFHQDERGGGMTIEVRPDQSYNDEAPGTVKALSSVNFNDRASSIYFLDNNGNRIYSDGDVE